MLNIDEGDDIMIINYDFYYCNKCRESHHFDTSKEYSKLCPNCNEEMEFWTNANGDTDLAEQRKNQTPIVPSSKPVIKCPYCQSTPYSSCSNGSGRNGYGYCRR